MLKAASATQKQIHLVRLHEQSKKNLEQDIQNYREEAQKQRKIIYQLEKERDRYINEASDLTQRVCSFIIGDKKSFKVHAFLNNIWYWLQWAFYLIFLYFLYRFSPIWKMSRFVRCRFLITKRRLQRQIPNWGSSRTCMRLYEVTGTCTAKTSLSLR